jgi:hypothetical protein
MSAKVILWSLFSSTTGASALLALGLAFACGSVDPADNQPSAGSGGSAAGEGSGNTSNGGAEPSEAGAGPGGSGGSGGSGGGEEPQLEPLLPWNVGNTWTYEVTKDGVTTIKTTTVEDLEEVGGTGPNADVMAYFVVTAKGADLMDRTESWQAADPENPLRIVRFRERAFGAMTGKLELEEHWAPAKLHIDGSAERTTAETTWLEDYEETKLAPGLSPTTHAVRDLWTVIANDETVEVPAGTFENVIHFRKAGGGSTKEYWYARGVGKLKETGSQIEELTAFELVEGEP